MMLFNLSFKIFLRELRSGYLTSILVSLVLAVTIVSGISLFTDRLEKALSAETEEFLGGNLKFESNQNTELSVEERQKEIKRLFSQARIHLPPKGIKRFYFELKNGEIDFIEMDPHNYQAFSAGEFSVVEDPKGRLCVLNQKALLELYALDSEYVTQSV